MDTKVLIVEDEVEVREEYKRRMEDRYPSLSLAGETGDIQEALRIIQSTPVDVVILDLELDGNYGVIFLEYLRKSKVEKPFILAVTKVNSKKIHNAIRNMGVDSIIVKGGAHFNWDIPLATIEIVVSRQQMEEEARVYIDKMNTQSQRELYKDSIQNVLKEMGFPSKRQGTNQCVDALLYMVMSGQKEICVTKQIYPYVAGLYNTEIPNVETNIRKSIERVWRREHESKLRKWYPYEWNQETDRPTNAEFLTNMAKRWM